CLVVDDEQAWASELRLYRLHEGWWAARGLLGQHGEGEGRPLADLALHPDGPAHHLGEALADGKAEAGAAVAACRRGVQLAERLEESVHAVGRDADAGVPDREVERVPAIGGRARGEPKDAHAPPAH